MPAAPLQQGRRCPRARYGCLQDQASFTSTICFSQMPMHVSIPYRNNNNKPGHGCLHSVPTTARWHHVAAARGAAVAAPGWAGLRFQTLAQIILALACYIRQNASAGARRARLWGFPCARALAAGPRRVRQRARCERREQARLRENKRLAAPPRRQRRPTLRLGTPPSLAA